MGSFNCLELFVFPLAKEEVPMPIDRINLQSIFQVNKISTEQNRASSQEPTITKERHTDFSKKSYLFKIFLLALFIAIGLSKTPADGQLKDLWDIGKDIYEMRQNARKEEEKRQRKNLPRTNIATIRWAYQGSRFFIMGPNPTGEWASEGFIWMPIVILFESDCRDTVYLDSQFFKLEEHNGPNVGRVYSPTIRGMQYQKNRLHSGWVRPGEDREGYLTFEVPDPLYNFEYRNHRNLSYSLHHPNFSNCYAYIKLN
jgi:hypothetical protein